MPAAIDEVTPELPVDVQADFPHDLIRPEMPLQKSMERTTTDFSCKKHLISAVKAAEDGKCRARSRALFAGIETGGIGPWKWYIAAIACQRVGDFLRDPQASV